MNDVAEQNEKLAETVRGCLRPGALNLVVEPRTDGGVGVIVRPLVMVGDAR